jgi:hypothetical protein
LEGKVALPEAVVTATIPLQLGSNSVHVRAFYPWEGEDITSSDSVVVNCVQPPRMEQLRVPESVSVPIFDLFMRGNFHGDVARIEAAGRELPPDSWRMVKPGVLEIDARIELPVEPDLATLPVRIYARQIQEPFPVPIPTPRLTEPPKEKARIDFLSPRTDLLTTAAQHEIECRVESTSPLSHVELRRVGEVKPVHVTASLPTGSFAFASSRPQYLRAHCRQRRGSCPSDHSADLSTLTRQCGDRRT